jgi:outer membrane protein assembly factor BamB
MRRLSQFSFVIPREKERWRRQEPLLDRGQSVRENGHRRGVEIAYSSPMRNRLFALTIAFAAASANAQWSQFAGNPKHTGNAGVIAQPLGHVMADTVVDPFVTQEIEAGSGELGIHYAVPLLDGDDVFMVFKGRVARGPLPPMIVWGVTDYRWQNGQLAVKWSTGGQWQPVPNPGWEPPMQPVLANGFVYAPEIGGTLLQLDRNTGAILKRINPFGSVDQATFMSGPPAADSSGNIVYGAFRLNLDAPWTSDVTAAWLVRVTPDGTATAVPFAPLVPGAPAPAAQCTSHFASGSLHLPPSPGAVAPASACGSQRPGLNVAPAIASDGTIYIVSRAHLNERWGYLAAVNPDLTPKWNVSLRERFHDGCGVLLPAGTCSEGAHLGVDPSDNLPGSGAVTDFSTASPVVLPDGTVLYGAYTGYNDGEGHLMHFSAAGTYLGAYPFGWDTTPAVWPHNGTFSVVTKHNFYGFALRPDPGEFMVQLDPNLNKEWEYRNPSITIDNQFGFEWCVNAAAIDANGTVYANAEDGILYAIGQGGVLLDKVTLADPLGAAYTPLAIDAQGRVYAQSGGHLFAVGGSRPRKRAVR